MRRYLDRRDAGRELASLLGRYAGEDVVVLALPRGGVPVADEVARELGAPLDVLIVRKLGVPGHEELAMGALASGGVQVLNQGVIDELRIPHSAIAAVVGRSIILVDDGLATGSTMRAAVEGLRRRGPRRIAVAVPVAATQTCEALAGEVDDILCAQTPEPFLAVGLWYQDFGQTTDEEVREVLEEAARRTEARAGAGEGAP